MHFTFQYTQNNNPKQSFCSFTNNSFRPKPREVFRDEVNSQLDY